MKSFEVIEISHTVIFPIEIIFPIEYYLASFIPKDIVVTTIRFASTWQLHVTNVIKRQIDSLKKMLELCGPWRVALTFFFLKRVIFFMNIYSMENFSPPGLAALHLQYIIVCENSCLHSNVCVILFNWQTNKDDTLSGGSFKTWAVLSKLEAWS